MCSADYILIENVKLKFNSSTIPFLLQMFIFFYIHICFAFLLFIVTMKMFRLSDYEKSLLFTFAKKNNVCPFFCNTITNVPGLVLFIVLVVLVVPVKQRRKKKKKKWKKSYDLIIIILINVDYVEGVVVVCWWIVFFFYFNIFLF